MPIDRHHAFASGPAYPHPLRQQTAPADDVAAQVMAAWSRFLRDTAISDGASLGPRAWCVNGRRDPGAIRIGDGVIVRGLLRVESFGAGEIDIADHVYVGDDVLISASCGVRIGRATLLAHGVQIFDNDSHPVDWREREAHFLSISGGRRAEASIAMMPVVIGENAWIGLNSLVFKGVSIGDRSIIAAGSVVTSDVPPDCLAAGNPAKVVRSLATSD